MTNQPMEVSCFPNIKTTTNPKTLPLPDVLQGVKKGAWKDKQEKVRELKAIWETDPESKEKKKAYKSAKHAMPAITISGTFSKRNNDSLLQHSSALQIDLDGDDNPSWTVEKMKETLADDPYIYSVGVSLSGDGVKGVALIPADPEKHLDSFLTIQGYFRDTYGLNMDDATKDISRPCFVWHDPELIIKEIESVKIVEPIKNDSPLSLKYEEERACPLSLTSTDQIDPITIEDATPQRPLEDAIEALRAIKDGIGKLKYDPRLYILSGMFNSYGQAGYDAVQEVFGKDGFDKPIKDLTDQHTAGTVFHMATELSRVKSNPPPIASDGDEFLRELESMVASTPDHIRKMEEQARDAVFVLPRIACLGDLTIINARFSTGKTLLTLWLLSQRDLIDTQGLKIFYINADDSFNGAIEKAILSESIGVHELVPGQAGFTSDKLEWIIKSAIKTERARDVVIILDTLKKFVDTMDKTQARKINLLLREFSGCGGTVIALAHTNKHKIAGESVAEGVGDFLSDFDCAYLMDEVEPTPENVKTIVLKNQKLRNPNAKEVHFIYDTTEGMSWSERFESVEMVGNEQAKAVCAEAKADAQHKEDLPTIMYLEQRIYSSREPISATALCQLDLDGHESSRGQRERVLSLYADTNPNELHRHWRQRKMEKKNGTFYTPPEKIEPF